MQQRFRKVAEILDFSEVSSFFLGGSYRRNDFLASAAQGVKTLHLGCVRVLRKVSKIKRPNHGDRLAPAPAL